MRPSTGTWEKGEGFKFLPLKEKEPTQVTGRIILNLRLGPSHKAGNISVIQICAATLDSHRGRIPPRPQGWLTFMPQVSASDSDVIVEHARCCDDHFRIGTSPVTNRKLKRMCRAIGADTTQVRGLSSKWRAFNDCCANPPGSRLHTEDPHPVSTQLISV